MLYTGDLVDEKSRTVKLLARADNPERLLKPGMFVEVEIHSTRAADGAEGPGVGLLTDGERTFVYVQTGPDGSSAARSSRAPRGGRVVVRGA